MDRGRVLNVQDMRLFDCTLPDVVARCASALSVRNRYGRFKVRLGSRIFDGAAVMAHTAFPAGGKVRVGIDFSCRRFPTTLCASRLYAGAASIISIDDEREPT